MNEEQSPATAGPAPEPAGWLNRNVLGAGLTSFLADASYETATAVLPGFLSALGASALSLGVIEGVADAYLHISVGADIGVELDFKQFPPGVKINPKVTDLGLDLQDIRLRGGPIFTGEKGERIASDIKGLLRAAVKVAEPPVKNLVNDAIARSIEKGRGALSPGELFKALPASEREKKNGK